MRANIACILFLLITAPDYAIAQGRDTIVWSKKRLVPGDFRQNDLSDPKVTFVAKTRWLLYFQLADLADQPNVKVPVIYAAFFPKFSWIKEGAKGNEDVLRHEQLHFDITELHARKLRQRLENLVISSMKIEKLARSYSHEINSDLFHMQEKYDWDTNHGTDKAKQVWWITFIFLQLQKLGMYTAAR